MKKTLVLLVVMALAAFPVAARASFSVLDTGNVLSGMSVEASSELSDVMGTYAKVNVTNDIAGYGDNGELDDFLFSADSYQRIAIYGFNSSLNRIRLWSANDLDPLSVTIRCTTSDITGYTAAQKLDAANYATELLPVTSLVGTWTLTSETYMAITYEYIDIAVAAPAGTQALYFAFTGPTAIAGYSRIAEIQGFVPEPATMSLLGCGIVGMLLRKKR